MSVLIGITSCDYFEYTVRAARTALDYTPDSHVLIVDDASDGWDRDDPPEPLRSLLEGPYADRVTLTRYKSRFGLTRSWNRIVEHGDQMGFDFTVISNNDVVFTRNWFEAISMALSSFDYDLAGPLTNAPGPTARGLQQVERYHQDFQAVDDQDYLNRVADELRSRFLCAPVASRVNGFCFAAKTEKWLEGPIAPGQAFNLYNDFNSRGERNDTPTMTLMEDEYQNRLYARGGTAAVCPGSFVLHYRSVWRGDRYARYAHGPTLRRHDEAG